MLLILGFAESSDAFEPIFATGTGRSIGWKEGRGGFLSGTILTSACGRWETGQGKSSEGTRLESADVGGERLA